MKYRLIAGPALLLLCFPAILFPQKINTGQQLPGGLVLKNVLNAENETLDVSAIHKKLIILDFWNTACISCIQAFPLLDSLQKQFDHSIQFILVNTESKDSTLRFFNKRKKIRMPPMPIVTGDSVLRSLFPIDGYPYSVWVGEDKTVRARTYGYFSTVENIESFLEDEANFKDPGIKKMRYGTLFSLGEEEAQEKMKFYSHISSCINTLDIGSAQYVKQPDNNRIGISCNCQSIVDLFKIAFSEFYKYDFNDKSSLILHLKNGNRYLKHENLNESEDGAAGNTYNYELSAIESMAPVAYKIMQRDLGNFFNIHAERIRKPVLSHVLVKIPGKNLLRTKGGIRNEQFNFYELREYLNDSIRCVINSPFAMVSQEISNWVSEYTGMPFYDQTGIKENVDITIPSTAIIPFNLANLRKELKKYGLDIIKKKIVKEVLVLREKKFSGKNSAE